MVGGGRGNRLFWPRLAGGGAEGFCWAAGVGSDSRMTCCRARRYGTHRIRLPDEPNSGRVSAWQDHAGSIHSLLSGRN